MNLPGESGDNKGIRVVNVTTRMLGFVGAVFLFSMMVLTFVDVWGRYIFNAPVPGGFEITELMMATLIFAGLPLITLHDEHITVDLLESHFPKSMMRWRDALIGILCTGMMAVLSHRMWLKAEEQVEYGDRTAALYIPVAPVTYFMSVAAALSCVLLIIITWAKITNHRKL